MPFTRAPNCATAPRKLGSLCTGSEKTNAAADVTPQSSMGGFSQSRKGWDGGDARPLFVLAQRAASEGPRWTRAVKRGQSIRLLGKQAGKSGARTIGTYRSMRAVKAQVLPPYQLGGSDVHGKTV